MRCIGYRGYPVTREQIDSLLINGANIPTRCDRMNAFPGSSRFNHVSLDERTAFFFLLLPPLRVGC